METEKKWQIASLVIIICLTVALIACLFWVRSLSDRLEVLEFDYQSLSYSAGKLSINQSMLESKLSELFRDVTDLTDELEYSIVGAGIQPNTAACLVTLIPKELAEDTTVDLTIGDSTVSFSRNGDTFMGTIDIPLFEENEAHPVLTITSAGITKKDELEEIDLWYAYRYCLPDLFQSMNGVGVGTNEDPTKTDVFLAYAYRQNIFDTYSPVYFTKITMTTTINGEEGPCQNVTNQFIDYGDYAEFKVPDIAVSNTDRMTVVIRAEDSLGYVHELTTQSGYVEEQGSVIVVRDETVQIYGPDGVLLYRSPFDDLT